MAKKYFIYFQVLLHFLSLFLSSHPLLHSLSLSISFFSSLSISLSHFLPLSPSLFLFSFLSISLFPSLPLSIVPFFILPSQYRNPNFAKLLFYEYIITLRRILHSRIPILKREGGVLFIFSFLCNMVW